MKKSKLLAVITGGAFLLDCIMPPGMAMGTFMLVMGVWTVITVAREGI